MNRIPSHDSLTAPHQHFSTTGKQGNDGPTEHLTNVTLQCSRTAQGQRLIETRNCKISESGTKHDRTKIETVRINTCQLANGRPRTSRSSTHLNVANGSV